MRGVAQWNAEVRNELARSSMSNIVSRRLCA